MTAHDWFTKSRKEGFAIGAFNVDSLEIFKGIILGAMRKKSPVIVEFSPGEVGYFGLKNIVDLVRNTKEDSGVPILLNLDHGKPKDAVVKAIEVGGFDEVHFDGSDLDFGENIKQAADVVALAHKSGILVEGEIDKVAGSSEVHTEEIDFEKLKGFYTKPERAKEFVEKSGVDIFSPVFGNMHGTFSVEADLDIELLSKIRGVLPNTFFAMHGGSGIAAVQVKEAIKVGGIVKINVNTEIRSTFRDALEEKLGEKPDEYKVYDLMPEVIAAVAAVVEDKIDVFGSADKA